MYAFGDTYNNSQRSVLYLHDFIKRFLIDIAKIVNECEFKKIIDHFYSYEYEKFYNYKKLKFKNNFITGTNVAEEMESDKKNELSDKIDSKINCFDDDLLSISGDDDDFNLGGAVDVGGEQVFNVDNKNEIKENKIEFENKNSSKSKKNYLENILKDKDENYYENLAFQDQRTSKMENTEYLEYINCRQQTFLSKGKKFLLNFLQNLLQNSLPSDFRDINNLELISFLLKEIMRKIITEAIKSKHPDKKLFVMNSPLTIEDFEELCKEEIEKLESFLTDFYSDIYLMKEFKKKKFCKNNNKNVKIKKCEGKTYIMIKKFIYLGDDDQSVLLRKIKKSSENKILSCANMLRDKYVRMKNNKASKISNQKRSSRNKQKDTTSVDAENSNKIGKEIGINKLVTDILCLDNFYEYFLIKDYIKEIDEDKINSAELNSRISQLNKINKRRLGIKFDEWLKMSKEERDNILDEFENIISKKNINENTK
jgi:hypothetical protein